jgi:integrase/recombinase XerD
MNASYKAILEEYVKWLDTLGYSEGLIISCRRNIRVFFEWLEENRIYEINRLTSRHINDYCNYCETRPNKNYNERRLSASHLNRIFYAVDKLLEFLHQYGMTKAPVPVNRRMEVNHRERILKIETFTQEEIKTLYDNIPNTYPDLSFEHRQAVHYELKLYFALFYGCGLRRSEGYN